MARKKTKVVVQPVPTEKQPTLADKQYIAANYNKLSEDQLAKDTGLTHKQISNLISSPELDNIDAKEAQQEKPINLRRFAKIRGTIQMTSAQAALDDKTLRDSGAGMSMEERYGPDFQRVVFKQENITRGQ